LIATKALSIPQLDPDSNLSRYLQEIRKFPLLKRDEEFRLAKRWREDGDSDAAHRLVTSHLRLVAKIAMGYRGYGLPMGELISEGNVGMMQAVKRFDPDRGFRLSTYAMWWIKAAIHEFVMHSWSLVKIGTTTAQKKLFFNLRRIKADIQAFDEGDLDPDDVKTIAHRLDVREDEVVKMNRRMLAPDNSLNAPLRVDGEGEWQDWLVDQSDSQETRLADQEELDQRRLLLQGGLERARNTASRANACAKSRSEPSRSCRNR
jgi:RNA polymerase sigma-32 factor